MVKIDIKNTTLRAIENRVIKQNHRSYLGFSEIGHQCDRYLWFSFRHAFDRTITPRLQRLFNRGHAEEDKIIKALDEVGVRCYNDQEEYIAVNGHFKGHCDSHAIGVIEAPTTVHLAEFKTMNDKKFKECQKNGVKVANYVYYIQMQMYMHYSGLTRSLFVSVNKNDDSMYIERIKPEKGLAEDFERKAEEIIYANEPPKREFPATWFECRWCDAKDVCEGALMSENCRTCKDSDPYEKGLWFCNHYNIELAPDQQKLACNEYRKLEV